MLPLTVITWKLEDLTTERFESLILPIDMREQTLYILNHQYNGIYYLVTCQRILIALEGTSSTKINQFIDSYRTLLDLENIPNPDIHYKESALKHLLEIVCALDSIVIGETEIQGQFKNAYNEYSNYLTPFLKYVLSRVLRTGKRIRTNTIFKNGKISTISMVEEILQQKFYKANSIAVVGTGKMAKGVVRYLSKNYSNLDIYTRRAGIVGNYYKGIKIKHLRDFFYHEIVITATNSSNLIDKNLILDKEAHQDWIFVDLGIPRNCSSNLEELSNIDMYDMARIISISKSRNQNEDLVTVYDELEQEFHKIINEYKLEQEKEKIVNLRKDLWSVAKRHKNIFNENSNNSKDFDLFVKELIHVSQKHLEEALIPRDESYEN